MNNIALALIVSSNFCFSQNLVPNGSFELANTIPCGWSNSNTEFNTTVIDWNSPTLGTPDIHSMLVSQSCWNNQPNAVYTGPGCSTGSQVPHSGNNFAGLYTYSPSSDVREYIQVQLTTPMVPGTKYYVKLYVSLADQSDESANNMGLAFSASGTYDNIQTNLANTPNILFTDVISDETNWVLLMDSLTPSDAYEYLIIGNFMDDAGTTTVSGSGCITGAYYYIDDVCVSTDTSMCHSGVGLQEVSDPNRVLVRIVDLMGRESEDKPNTPLIYIYSDGTTKRVYRME